MQSVTLDLDDKIYEEIENHANLDNRSIKNYIKNATLHFLENENLTDEFETENIYNNKSLLENIEQGHRDALNKKGQFVE